MNRWAAVETYAGRVVMKSLQPRLIPLFKVVLPTPMVTRLFISRAVDNHLAMKDSK